MDTEDPCAASRLAQTRFWNSNSLVLSVLVLLIVVGVIRSVVATRFDSLDIDESYHITAGVSYVRLADYRLNPEHPPLVKLWVGSFLTSAIFQLPPLVQMGDKIGERHYTAAAVYLTNDPDKVQHRARVAMLLFNGLLLLGFGLTVWRVLHPGLALAAILFLIIDPTVAAHLPVVLTDLPVSLLASTAFLLAFHAFRTWRIADVVMASLVTGLTLGAKHSAPTIVAAIFLMGLAMAILSRAVWRVRIKRAVSVFALVVFAWTVLWSFYRFRFNESPAGIDTFNRPLAAKIEDVNSPALRKAIALAAEFHLLPRSYLWGFADIVRAGIEGRIYSVYFWGRPYIRRVPAYFFPAVIFFKLPIGLDALVLLGLFTLVTGMVTRECCRAVWAFVGFGLFLLAVLAAANSGYAGIRHALPVLPVLSVLAALPAVFAIEFPSRWIRAACLIALAGALASAVPVVRPWEYYNELAGGSAGGYRHFSDDGTENGQRVKEFADFYHRELEPKAIVPYVEYWFFFNDEEFQRRGIKTIQSTWEKDESLDPGSTIAGTVIMNARWIAPNPWGDYSSLRAAQPALRFGNLLIYKGKFNLPDANAWRLFFRGIAAMYADRPDLAKAEDYFRHAASLAPHLFFSNLELGNLLAQRGAREEAIAAYENARLHSPSQEPVTRRLTEQIERIQRNDPKTVAPVRDPYLE
jgi:tetratricopeptide (TPR) repeat protein